MNWGHFAAFADLWVFRRSWRMRLLLVVGLCVTLTPVYAQEPAPYTLHVNIRLMQIPTLVLSPTLRPLPPVDAKRFRIQVDSGPSFRPTAVRREGNDPISLAVLLDLSGNEDDLISAFDRDLSPWIAASLRPADRIAIYGLDCVLVRTKGYMAADPALVQEGFKNILHAPGVHGTRLDSSCGHSLHLWDALKIVSRQVAAQPGRGVILAVTTGEDHGSMVKLSDLERFAAGQSVSIFGLSENVSVFNGPGVEEGLSPLCEYSGGLLFVSSGSRLAQSLSEFVSMVRGRYILEYPEPANAKAGVHSLRVTIDHTLAFIRPAGVTAILNQPTDTHDIRALPGDTRERGSGSAHDP
jgi:hypothetical protein